MMEAAGLGALNPFVCGVSFAVVVERAKGVRTRCSGERGRKVKACSLLS